MLIFCGPFGIHPTLWEYLAGKHVGHPEEIRRTAAAFIANESDFDVCSAVEPRKPHQIGKKQNFRSENFVEQEIFGVEK